MAYIVWHIVWHIVQHVVWHIVWHIVWHVVRHIVRHWHEVQWAHHWQQSVRIKPNDKSSSGLLYCMGSGLAKSV